MFYDAISFHVSNSSFMKTFCYIPPVCLEPGEISSQVRRLLGSALADKVSPAGLPRDLQSIVVDLDETEFAKVKEIGKSLGLAPGRVVGSLIYGLYLKGEATGASDGIELKLDHLRPGQIRTLQMASPYLREGRVVLSECGTGSGKGRIVAHAAAYALAIRDAKRLPAIAPVNVVKVQADDLPKFMKEYAVRAQNVRATRLGRNAPVPPGPVIACAPTVENVAHLAREWAAARDQLDPDGKIRTALVLGRAQFVSAAQLTLMVSEADSGASLDEIQQWLANGMPTGLTSATQYLHGIEPRLCGLMADLEFLAHRVDFAHQDAALDPDSPAEEQALYQELRAQAWNADLVFTTHAMLCLDNMLLSTEDRKELLPYPCALLIDEAHLLEPTQASVAAKSLSFVRLVSELRREGWGDLRKDSAAKAALATARQAIDLLKNMPDETPLPVEYGADPSAITAWHAVQPTLRQLTEDLKALAKGLDSKKRAPKQPNHLRALRYVQRSIGALTGIANGYKGFIGHSPVRGQISFTIGPSTVGRYLAARWATTPMAMLLSGTLTHIGANGASTASTVHELSIPMDRHASTAPLHPAWLRETPTLMMPSTNQYHRFIPPSGEEINDLSLALWLTECAKVINLAARDAKGGMLVLMTGYDRLDGLRQALERDHPELMPRLVVQSRHQRVSSCASQFKTLARAGQRPIWLATGAAWTGLDLADETISDKDASHDVLLTDLVMPNLPFGLDKTTSHVSRVNRLGFGIETVATQRRLRQGLGRLVRREGLKHRRIWLLDGRLQHPAAVRYTTDLRRVLLGYIHRMPFEI